MAAALKDTLGVEATLIPGSGGIFEVAVEGAVVAAKTRAGFPEDAQCVEAVKAAL